MRQFTRQLKRIINKTNEWKENDIKIICKYTDSKKNITMATTTKSIVMGLDYIEILGNRSNTNFDGIFLYFHEVKGIQAYYDKYILKLNNGDIIKIAARM